ncbi:MAG: hypothetical protein ACOX0Z_02615 [Candidatus Nanosyncoccaceae bacterium]|jgi:CHASE3 domain sensor protein
MNNLFTILLLIIAIVLVYRSIIKLIDTINEVKKVKNDLSSKKLDDSDVIEGEEVKK